MLDQYSLCLSCKEFEELIGFRYFKYRFQLEL